MKMDVHQVIKRPLHSEKSVAAIGTSNQYHFEVDRRAGKRDVRQAIEDMFPNVHVLKVNTLWMRGKPRRRGYTRGRTKDRKKAIVKLKEGESIDIGY